MRSIVILRRALATLPLMLALSILTFLIMRIIPGDPVDIIIGQAGTATKEEIDLVRRELYLDRPLYDQLLLFLRDLSRADLGLSFSKRRPVISMLISALPATIELALASLVLAVLLGIPAGVYAAIRQSSLVDRVSMAAAFLGISLPPFWLGILAILVFSVRLGWLPTSGRLSDHVLLQPVTGLYVLDSLLTRNWPALWDALSHLLLPATTLSASIMGLVARMMRSSMLEVLREQYVTTARAKGLAERSVVIRHALRNALIPTVTVIGLQLGTLLGGNMIVETVFGWPGLGRVVVDAIFSRDYPVVQGAVLLYTFTFLAINLLVDVAYTYLNPRIQF
jgi:peptide/nickel transport system permease protein